MDHHIRTEWSLRARTTACPNTVVISLKSWRVPSPLPEKWRLWLGLRIVSTNWKMRQKINLSWFNHDQAGDRNGLNKLSLKIIEAMQSIDTKMLVRPIPLTRLVYVRKWQITSSKCLGNENRLWQRSNATIPISPFPSKSELHCRPP